ncbi:unnamed protein product [Thelazia callipaeda]|uniref:Serine/threonine-protein phosphatase n=1 Tax=Thelazia callipaeda TaxID=103827 RepID=A0A0N5D5V0_THECL|nr:unnamed protein product [Thelazia callipaeda]
MNDSLISKSFRKAVIEKAFYLILHGVQYIYNKEPIMLEFDLPENGMIVVGDLHGDLNCLFSILLENGFPPASSYLFLGDYIDRGKHQVELIFFIFLMKLRWPNYVTTLKGNHENYEYCKENDFFKECSKMFKRNSRWFTLINFVFDHMPICAIISNYYFVCHGGISQWLTCRSNVKNIRKPAYTCDLSFVEGVMLTDLLWADPISGNEEYVKPFSASPRECGYSFNQVATRAVLLALKAKVLIRGHEYYPNGVMRNFNDRMCYTVHSAPDFDNEEEAMSGALKLTRQGNKFKEEERCRLVKRDEQVSDLIPKVHEALENAFLDTIISYNVNQCYWCQQPYPLFVTRRKRYFTYLDIWQYMWYKGRIVLEHDDVFKYYFSRFTDRRRIIRFTRKKFLKIVQMTKTDLLERAAYLFPMAYDINSGCFNHASIICPRSFRICMTEDELDLIKDIYKTLGGNPRQLPSFALRKFEDAVNIYLEKRKSKGRFSKIKKCICQAMGLELKRVNTKSSSETIPHAVASLPSEDETAGKADHYEKGNDMKMGVILNVMDEEGSESNQVQTAGPSSSLAITPRIRRFNESFLLSSPTTEDTSDANDLFIFDTVEPNETALEP